MEAPRLVPTTSFSPSPLSKGPLSTASGIRTHISAAKVGREERGATVFVDGGLGEGGVAGGGAAAAGGLGAALEGGEDEEVEAHDHHKGDEHLGMRDPVREPHDEPMVPGE